MKVNPLLKRVLIVCGALVVVVAIALALYINALAKTAVERVLAYVLDVDVSLGKVDLSLKEGRVDLYDLKIGNPPGFDTPEAFSLARASVTVDVGSLGSDTRRMKLIEIIAPRITIEQNLAKSNIKQLIDNASRLGTGEKGHVQADTEESKEAGSKVVIDLVRVENAGIIVASTLLPKNIEFTLPKLEIKDIGKDGGGTTVAEAIAVFLNRVLAESLAAGKGVIPDDVVGVLKSGTEAVGQTVELGKKTLDQTVGSVTGGIKEGVTGLFGKDDGDN